MGAAAAWYEHGILGIWADSKGGIIVRNKSFVGDVGVFQCLARKSSLLPSGVPTFVGGVSMLRVAVIEKKTSRITNLSHTPQAKPSIVRVVGQTCSFESP
jgi:hypothetical protein